MENQNQTVVNNFERTRPSSNKVTVGYKISPQNKLLLHNRATSSNLSLSEYCEMIILNYLEAGEKVDKTDELLKKIEFYENQILKDLYEKHKGETISFVNVHGCPLSIKMNSIEDAYTILIHSFKTNDND